MTNGIQQKTLGWFSIFRLGLVQACLGAVVLQGDDRRQLRGDEGCSPDGGDAGA